MTSSAYQKAITLSHWTDILRKTALAGLVALPLSACVVYPDAPPPGDIVYDGGACCYSYYDYPRTYPYYYGAPTFEFGGYGHGGGWHDGRGGGGWHDGGRR